MGFLVGTLAWLLGISPSGGGAPSGITIALDPPTAVEAGVSGARPLVVIDPGHGGADPGAISTLDGTPEKEATLAIARAIRDELVASGRVRVALTRNDDRFLMLRDRYGIARRARADLFISVHADAAPENDGARGATIYTLSEVASDREAALLAIQQNQSDRLGGAQLGREPGVNLILIDLSQRQATEQAVGFARLLRREGEAYFPFRPQYHRFASLLVLKAPDVPSILLETGYLTNPADAAYILSADGRRQIARGVRRAVEVHFARRLIAEHKREEGPLQPLHPVRLFG